MSPRLLRYSLEPGQAEYRHAIATSNLLFHFSRPDGVILPKHTAQIQTIVSEVTIKCNGHSYTGHSTAFSGLFLDLRGMKNVRLDMESMAVTMDAGYQWGDVYEMLIMGRHDGFIINGGRGLTVGVSGFILGARVGPFTRSFGMGADTLVEATLVTANGSLVTVKEYDPPTSNKGRLFCALRGAGGGNFGVAVQMKLDVQELRNRHGILVARRYQWFPETGFTDDVVAIMNDFYATVWPEKLTINTTWICDLRQASNVGGVIREFPRQGFSNQIP